MHKASPPDHEDDDVEEAKTVLMAGPSAEWMIEDLQARYARNIDDSIEPLGLEEDHTDSDSQAGAYQIVDEPAMSDIPDGTLEHQAVRSAPPDRAPAPRPAPAPAPASSPNMVLWVLVSAVIGTGIGVGGLYVLTLLQ